jgi:hypothetical protein
VVHLRLRLMTSPGAGTLKDRMLPASLGVAVASLKWSPRPAAAGVVANSPELLLCFGPTAAATAALPQPQLDTCCSCWPSLMMLLGQGAACFGPGNGSWATSRSVLMLLLELAPSMSPSPVGWVGLRFGALAAKEGELPEHSLRWSPRLVEGRGFPGL